MRTCPATAVEVALTLAPFHILVESIIGDRLQTPEGDETWQMTSDNGKEVQPKKVSTKSEWNNTTILKLNSNAIKW